MTKSVLGKRVLDALEANVGRLKDVGKRGTLRSREKPGAQEQDAPQTSRKKARTTASNKPEQEQEPDQKQEPKRKPVRPKIKKLYLSQGLYVGQDPNYDPRLNAARNLKKIQSIGEDKMIKQRKILPFPMFAGKRLLETGRDFVLPFDIFNPLPARQPKPEEWRKTHKSMYCWTSNHKRIC
jgi:histone-lysine N-methyltransferase ASH1L